MTQNKEIEAVIGRLNKVCNQLHDEGKMNNEIYSQVFTDLQALQSAQTRTETVTLPNGLKTCPLCAGEEVLRTYNHDPAESYQVFCGGCGCMTGLHETVELADEAWNTRTLQSAQARTETVEGDVVEHIDNIQTFCDGHHIDQCIDDEIRAVRAELTRTAPAEDVMEVDVEALKDYRTVRGITKMGEDFHLHGWNDCIDHLHEQGHLSPTPRKTLEDAQARSDMAEFAKIDDFEDVPLKTLDNSEQTDTNVAPRKTLNDAQNHNWDKSKFVRIDMETGEKVEPRLEHIEGLEEAIQVASGYEFDLGAVCSEDDYLVFLKAAKAYAADMEEK